MNRLKLHAAMFALVIGLLATFNQTARAESWSWESLLSAFSSESTNAVCTTNPVVINGSDSGPGTLRQAVADACAGSTITFSPSLPPTIALFSGGISIDKNITIAGPGAELLAIRKIPGSASNGSIFTASSNATAGISGVTLTGSAGGAVNNAGNLTLTDMVITGNTATLGGGVFNSNGTLTIIRTLISNNGGSLTNPVTNEGGGIFVFSGTVDVIDSIIANNFAANGGGIYNADRSTSIFPTGVIYTKPILTLTRSTVTGNIASFGISNYDGEGGGIFNQSTATLVNTDVRDNIIGFCFRPGLSCNLATPRGSGIFRDGGSLTLINSTVPDGIRLGINAGSFSNQNSLLPDSGANFGGGSVPDGIVNTQYNATLVANTNGVTYSLLGGSLPPGITLATNGNVVSLSGMTDKAGRFDFSVKGINGLSTSVTYYSFRFYYPPPPPNSCISNPVVTSGAIFGVGSFRQAISDACPGSTITFSYWVTGIYSESLIIDKNLTITGPGSGLLEVYGFSVNGGVTAAISGLKISHGGIFNSGTLTLTDSTVADTFGAGIRNNGNLTVTNSIIENNGRGTLGNQQTALEGGGIYSVGGTLSIINSTVRNNYALKSGGGVWNGSGSTMTMTNSTVSGNYCQSNIENYGGGISNYGTATITNSTISGNTVGGSGQIINGGGIYNVGTMSLVNSTVFGNRCNFNYGSSGGYGCGIASGGHFTNVGFLTSRNSIIAGNYATVTGGGISGFVIGIDYDGTLNSQGYNIIGNTVDTTIAGDTTGNITNVNARLAPLGNYGGPTQTHALLTGSPAINAGNTATSPATDQRGAARVGTARVGTADIGSFELNTNSANGGTYTSQLPDGFLQTAYNYTITPDRAGFTYTLTGGALPGGLSVTTNGASVSITGTPTVTGNFGFSVTATNGTNSFVTNYRLLIQDVFGGSFDSADCSAISGWAWDRRYPNSPVNVNIYADNNLIATVSADQFRQDLLNAGIGNGYHGFNLATPENLRDGQPHQIRVQIVSTNLDIGNSPRTVTCTIPTVTPTPTPTPTPTATPTPTPTPTITPTPTPTPTPNTPPNVVNDAYDVDEDTTLNVNAPGVLGNDTDSEGDALTAVLVSSPTNAASFALNDNGSFSYTPNANFNGTDSFTYTASDNIFVSNTATVTITVNAVNDAPTIMAAVGLTRQQAAGASNSTIAAVNDIEDAAAALSVTVNNSSSAIANGVTISNVAVNAAGNVTADVAANCGATNASFTLKVADSGNLMATAVLSVAVTSETTPPVITLNGANPLTVNALSTFTDPGATANDNCVGTVAVTSSGTVNVNVAGSYTITYTATDGVNTATATRTVIVVDTTPPVITPVVTGTPGNNGWYRSNIGVSWTITDNESTVSNQSGCDTQTVTTDTNGVTFTCSATSGGGTTTESVTVKRDTTNPTIVFVSRTAANSFGWNNTNVTVNWSCSDATSGVVNASVSQIVSTEGLNQSSIGTCEDSAGNTASDTQTGINIDKTAPNISYVSRTAANANGWNNTNVTVNWNCSDALSGETSASVSQILTAEGLNQSATGTCTDKAGNTASNTQTGINIDLTAPTLAPTVSPNPVLLNGTATAAANAADNLSGIASQSCGAVDTTSVGFKTAACTATDLTGNTANVNADYQVVYNFTGFFSPVENLPTVNIVNAGQAVSVKFSLGGYQGLNIVAAGYPISTPIACEASEPGSTIGPTVNPGGSSLTYDSTTDQYSYLWKTDKKWKGTCRIFVIKFTDGSERYAKFRFK